MNYTHATLGIGLASLSLISSTPSPKETTNRKLPNIIIILIDDMGYGDLGTTAATGYETPFLNSLSRQGMQFTRFYSPQAVCSASRAGLLTGCYPNRVGISGALYPTDKIGLNPDETTIAELLKSRGYATGIVGKWHLGHLREFLPLQHGFDEYFGLPYSNDMWPVDYDGVPAINSATKGNRAKYPPLPLIEGNEIIDEVNTLGEMNMITTRYTERAVKFITEHRKSPFFLYLPHTMVHVPLGVSEKFKGKSKQGFYGDVMMEVDWSVGEILNTLKKYKLDDNTLIIFTSDNGPWLNFGNHAGNTGGLREGKTTTWEGGQRVPCIFSWPDVIKPGTVCSSLSSSIDLLPTLADITSSPLPDKIIDGVSLLPLLMEDPEACPRRTFYYYFQKNSLQGVQMDYWKLVLPHKTVSYSGVEPGSNGKPGQRRNIVIEKPELYDLRRDPGEQFNVIDWYPEKLEELQRIAEKARIDLGDDLTGYDGSSRRKPGMADE